MKILGIDSSAKTASAAVVENGKVLALCYSNTGFTHSVTLMPMVQNSLAVTALRSDNIDAYAVSIGPGSFTGIRIGVAAVKGMAQPQCKPCVPVSTLEAAAYPLRELDCIAVSVMDARCNQVYEAEFRCEGGIMTRITEDDAISIEELYSRLEKADAPVYFIGDGAMLCYKELSERLSDVRLAPEQMRYQRADSVALLAEEKIKKGEFVTPEKLNPVYLRDSQAQQNLKKKNK